MNINKIHFVYLIPRDRANTTAQQIEHAALHMQAFCRWQMGNGKTFSLTNPIVTVCYTPHDSSWYSTFTEDPNAPHREWYWANGQRDARDLAGAGFYQEHNSWVIYLDAPPVGDQYAGGASVNGSGLCLMGDRDCASLRGQDPEWTLCRGVGGGLHETLHTLGIPHPSPPPDPDWTHGVMGIGYMNYPNAILTENDKWTLDHHRFFAVEPRHVAPAICRFADGRPQPRPRLRPSPIIRPTRQQPATT